MFQTIFVWLAGKLLTWVLGEMEKGVKDYLAKLAEDKERKTVNEENIRKYDEAVERKKRVEAALDLLNRNNP